MRTQKFLTKYNQRRQSDVGKRPIEATEMTLAGFHPGTVKFSGRSTMKHSSLCEVFTPLLFMNDYVRQALTDRTAFLPEVRAQLSYFKYLVESYNDWKMDTAIEEWGNMTSDYHCNEDVMCLSCGVNPGAEFLGYAECSECYDDH